MRKRAMRLHSSKTSVSRGMKRLDFRGYKIRRVQELTSSDHTKRKRFCDDWISRLGADLGLQDQIFWSDECLIRLGDQIDISNVRIYAKSNPHALVETSNSRLGVMFLVAISSRGIIGPIFTSNNLDSKNIWLFCKTSSSKKRGN